MNRYIIFLVGVSFFLSSSTGMSDDDSYQLLFESIHGSLTIDVAEMSPLIRVVEIQSAQESFLAVIAVSPLLPLAT